MHMNNDIPHSESSEHFLSIGAAGWRASDLHTVRRNDIIVRAEQRQVVEYQERKTRLG